MTFPYRVPESAPDYEADDITDALRAACMRHPLFCDDCDEVLATDGTCWACVDDAEAARIEAERVPCAKCHIYTVAAAGEWCRACDEERFGERCDFNDDGHEVMR
jgi:hypothetical protein